MNVRQDRIGADEEAGAVARVRLHAHDGGEEAADEIFE
jgi:hypothetical protein